MTDNVLKVVLAAGILMALIGLVIVPGAFSSGTRDQETLGTALALFGVGVLVVGVGLYLQARNLRARIDADPNLSAVLNAGKRKGTCDSCKSAAPLIQCTMHRVNLCGGCLVEHYEPRGCVYVPIIRRTQTRTSRGASAGRS